MKFDNFKINEIVSNVGDINTYEIDNLNNHLYIGSKKGIIK